MTRSLKRDWIETYTECLQRATKSPDCYHFWAAATCIAATLKRNVWIEMPTWRMFPNLFVVLVGRPGIGKGEAMNPALSLLKEAGTANILSDRTTMEYALEKLSKGFSKISSNGTGNIKLGTESSALIVSTELSVFITASQFSITCLTDLWDCREGTYQYGTRGKGEWNIREPLVGLFGASAQEWLVKSIPADAVGGGFTRRVNFVLGREAKDNKPRSDLWDQLKPDLIEDLRYISLIRGRFSLTKGAEALLDDYTKTCKPDDFDDLATSVYKVTKPTNVGKLAQVFAISRGDNLLVLESDIQRGIDEVEKVAADIKVVFRAVGESSLITASERVIAYLEARGFSSRKEILAHNWRHFTSGELDVILATLREAGMVYERTVGNTTLYAWKEKEDSKPII